ncbi:MAG: biopolymer transporter ExbD [Bacteroidales bacterium]|nr:biopolymer transporter ExbD [Bacteroidales bacterium]MCL2133209.1 biopolymer transporter ExbD [Bacteroidales bacterium]
MARPVGEINAGSMADIAFLILIYFLMTTTMDIDTGLARRLPPYEDTQEKIEINRRNIMVVLINKSDRLFAGNQPMEIGMLRETVKEFIMNPTDHPNKSVIERKAIPGIRGEVPVSKGVISLQNDRGTSYNAYIAVQNELVAAFNELRDDFSRMHFGKVYTALDDDQQAAVREAIPQTISEAEPKEVGAAKSGGR